MVRKKTEWEQPLPFNARVRSDNVPLTVTRQETALAARAEKEQANRRFVREIPYQTGGPRLLAAYVMAFLD